MSIGLLFGYVIAVFLGTFFFASIFQTVGFLISLKLKRNDIADVMWGLGFLIIAYMWFFLSPVAITFAAKVALFCISLWSLRLTLHIFERFRSHDKEDRRYKKWRDEWTHVKTRSFFQVFILQGAFMSVILLPFVLHINAGVPTAPLLILIGFVIWAIGFYYQLVGDLQLKDFLAKKKNKGHMMREGVWSHTRHPNYFGEMSMWWGIFIITLSIFHPLYILFAIVGPLSITVLLRYVSGVPMLENHWEEKYPDEFKEYKQETPMLVPNFIKLIKK